MEVGCEQAQNPRQDHLAGILRLGSKEVPSWADEAVAVTVAVRRPTDLDQPSGFPARGELTFARDAAMDEHWADHGYAAMADGAGPVALFYNIHPSLVVDVDVAGDGGLGDGPLSGWTEVELALPEATALTLVTHAPPAEDVFCAAILALLREALGYRRAVGGKG